MSGTVSIGVAGYPRSASDEDSLFRSADAALYAAKRSGKNRVSVHEDIGLAQTVSDGKGE